MNGMARQPGPHNGQASDSGQALDGRHTQSGLPRHGANIALDDVMQPFGRVRISGEFAVKFDRFLVRHAHTVCNRRTTSTVLYKEIQKLFSCPMYKIVLQSVYA